VLTPPRPGQTWFSSCAPEAGSRANYNVARHDANERPGSGANLRPEAGGAVRPPWGESGGPQYGPREQVESGTGQTVVLYIGDDFEGPYHIRDELDGPLRIGAC
jgi:hypothetical protein